MCYNIVIFYSDEEESSSDDYVDADEISDDDAEGDNAEADLVHELPRLHRDHSLYYSDDSFGYDDCTDEGK